MTPILGSVHKMHLFCLTQTINRNRHTMRLHPLFLSPNGATVTIRPAAEEEANRKSRMQTDIIIMTLLKEARTVDSRGPAEVLLSGRTAYKGSESLLVRNRTAAWNGAQRALNPRTFVPGNTYCFSVVASFIEGASSTTFCMKLQYVDGSALNGMIP